MSSQRYVSTSFWDDPWIQELDAEAKLLYMYLLTNSLTNIAGIYKITVRRISFDTGIAVSVVSEKLDMFEKSGKAAFFEEYIIIRNWPKHQKLSSKDTKAGIERVIVALPESVRLALKRFNYQYALPDPDQPQEGATRPPIGPPMAPIGTPIGPQEGDVPTLPIPTLIPSGLAARAKKTAEPKTEDREDQASEADALYAFALKIATDEKHAKNPAALARMLVSQADIRARFEASKPKPPRNDAYPEPGPCPKCGGSIKADRWDGEGRCLACGTWVKYDSDFENWEIAPVADTG